MIERSYLQNLIRAVWPKIRAATDGIFLIFEKVIKGSIRTIMEQIKQV